MSVCRGVWERKISWFILDDFRKSQELDVFKMVEGREKGRVEKLEGWLRVCVRSNQDFRYFILFLYIQEIILFIF